MVSRLSNTAFTCTSFSTSHSTHVIRFIVAKPSPRCLAKYLSGVFEFFKIKNVKSGLLNLKLTTNTVPVSNKRKKPKNLHVMQLMYEYLVNEASSSSASAADAGKVRGTKRLDEQACKHRGAAWELTEKGSISKGS